MSYSQIVRRYVVIVVATNGAPTVEFFHNGTQYKITGVPANVHQIEVKVPE